METSRQSNTRKVKEHIKIRVFEGEVDCVLTFFWFEEGGGSFRKRYNKLGLIMFKNINKYKIFS